VASIDDERGMAPLIVTGYVPIDNPRPQAAYRALGALLTVMPGVKFYDDTLENCWMWPHAKRYADTHAEGDNPAKNTLQYHVVQHQKIAWLARALAEAPYADPLIWVDYGVFHLRGITEKIIQGFMGRVARQRPTRITLPGCWPRNIESTPNVPCWRFCGTVAVVPRHDVLAFDTGVRLVALDRLIRERNVVWEVNTWARFEQLLPEMFEWYAANHDASLFANFWVRP